MVALINGSKWKKNKLIDTSFGEMYLANRNSRTVSLALESIGLVLDVKRARTFFKIDAYLPKYTNITDGLCKQIPREEVSLPVGNYEIFSSSSVIHGQSRTHVSWIPLPLETFFINPLPDGKRFDWSKLKQIADDILKCI